MDDKPLNRYYRDSVFVDLFARDITAKENFLSLYNALHDSHLKLEETTIEPVMLDQVLYMSFYNDVSMLINGKLVILVEHQSTINPNMPLRFGEYLFRIYEKLIDPKEKFARNLVTIPEPEFYVFYNGNDFLPAESELKLSESFPKTDSSGKKKSCIEILVKVYNIRIKGSEVLLKCPQMNQYETLVEYVQTGKKQGIKNPMKWAVMQCIKSGILPEYLRRKASEVENMLFTEYNYETDIAVQRAEAKQEGIKEGIKEGLREGKLEAALNLLKDGISPEKVAFYTGLPLKTILDLKNSL